MKTLIPALIALILMNSLLAFAQPGSLDSSFSKDGKMHSTACRGILIQPDGKILVAGDGFNIIRLKTNGNVDKSFGINGIASTSFEGSNNGYLLAFQPDGKIVIAGYSVDNFDIFYVSLARFTATGFLDSSFGINGQVKTDVNYYTPTGIAIASDGKILLTTSTGFDFLPNVLVLEYTANGSFHKEFGYDSGPYTRDISNALVIQPGGKIVVAGSLYNNDSLGSTFALLRFKPNGSPDNGFGTSGKIILNYGEGVALALQSNDKIVAISGDSKLLRFKKNGSPDTSFGTGGKIEFPFQGRVVALQQDGKIIVAGILDSNFAVARYKSNGKPDNTFGINGIAVTDLGKNDIIFDAALQKDGKIVVSGISIAKSYFGRCVLVRYNGDATSLNTNSNEIPSNIASQNFSGNVKTYPNPVKSVLNIDLKNTGSLKKTITIYDIKGKLLLTQSANGSTQLDVRPLAAGTYLIRIGDGHGKFLYGKFIKE